MAKESSIQTRIIKWINEQPECIAENVSGNAKQSGRADINACICGKTMKIEVKRPDSSYGTTKKQEIYLRKWEKAGAICLSVKTLDEVKQVIQDILEE